MWHNLSLEHFDEFFRGLNKLHSPFPWQSRLMAQILEERRWPDTIDLPTSFGKTSTLQIALFSMAVLGEAMPRRIFFVVDRRLIVDAAYQQACCWRDSIEKAESGVLRKVKDNLRKLAGHEFLKETQALEIVSLRGGVFRERRWAENPSAPTIICSTVDQVGSRLFFRGYGVSEKTLPRHAALVGNDSLILLDEAHCSRPFEQTMKRFEVYRDQENEDGQTLFKPAKFTVMTATPAEADENPFRFDAKDTENEVLAKRYYAEKPTSLVVADKVKGFKFASKLAKFIEKQLGPVLKAKEFLRLGIIVNNVETTRKTSSLLRKSWGKEVDVVLMTGRMRELDRTDLLKTYSAILESGSLEKPKRPLVVVATQCLEVGADFDFDFLFLECADLAAVEQRLGRLNRLGQKTEARAVLFVREDQQSVSPKSMDPIYGEAMPETWKYLLENSHDNGGTPVVDLGIANLRKLKHQLHGEGRKLTTESSAAPILLPPYLDCWAQTSPQPVPQAEVAPFLRGEERSSNDVQVVWRSFVNNRTREDILEELLLRPVTSSETLAVPISLFRSWLNNPEELDGNGEDLEGFGTDEDRSASTAWKISSELSGAVFRFVGSNDDRTSYLTSQTPRNDIRPNDLYVLDENVPKPHKLGDLFPQPLLQTPRLDRGDEAQLASRNKYCLTLSKRKLEELEAIGDSITLQTHRGYWARLKNVLYPDSKPNGLFDADLLDIEEVHETLEQAPEVPAETRLKVPDFYLNALEAAATSGHKKSKPRPFRTSFEPLHHYIFLNSRQKGNGSIEDDISTADDEFRSLEGEAITLEAHCARVGALAGNLATNLGLPQPLIDDLVLSGQLHDLGKTDSRFQAWLSEGSMAIAKSLKQAVAKSEKKHSLTASTRFRQAAGYPKGKRHEFLSAALLEDYPHLLKTAHDPELVKYLVAVHHGFARPWPLEPADKGAELIGASLFGIACKEPVNSDYGNPEKGHAERFWQLQKKYGRWQLAMLETVLTAADGMSSGRRDRIEPAATHLDFKPGSSSQASVASYKLPLTGLDGSNLLAFLAALGTLRLLSTEAPELNWKLSWAFEGTPIPVLSASHKLDGEYVLKLLEKKLQSPLLTELFSRLPDPNKFSLNEFREHAEQIEMKRSNWQMDWLCAFAAPIHRYVNGKPEDNLGNTAFRTLGAGRTSFVAALDNLNTCCTPKHLRRTLFETWDYKDLKNNLRLDGIDDRRYALMGSTPTNDSAEPTRTMWGANRLAFEAFPLFPVWPGIRRVDTAGFTTAGSLGTYFYWSLWDKPFDLNATRSLLWQRMWYEFEHPQTESLGIKATFRSQRFNFGKYRNFSPSESMHSNKSEVKIQLGKKKVLLLNR